MFCIRNYYLKNVEINNSSLKYLINIIILTITQLFFGIILIYIIYVNYLSFLLKLFSSVQFYKIKLEINNDKFLNDHLTNLLNNKIMDSITILESNKV